METETRGPNKDLPQCRFAHVDYRRVDSGPLLVEAIDQVRQSWSFVLKYCGLEKLLSLLKANEVHYFLDLFYKVHYMFCEIFHTCPDRPWGPPSVLYDGYQVFPVGKERPGRDADPSPLLVPLSRKSRAITLLPLWAVRPVQSFSAFTA